MTPLPRPQGERKLFNFKERYKNNEQFDLGIGLLYTDRYDHSQFSGKWVFKITRINKDSGDVFGVYHSGDVCEMDIEDVM